MDKPTDTPMIARATDDVSGAMRRAFLGGLGGVVLAQRLAVPALAAQATPAAQRASLDNAVTLGVARLNQLVTEQYAVFNEGNVLRPFDVATYGAASDIRLQRITTWTRVPETGESVKVSGLLAVPAAATGRLPVVCWQHGTLLGFGPVPSNLTLVAAPDYVLRDADDSIETLFVLQRLAANGYAVIAADYIGKGPFRDGRSEPFLVKGATTQCCIDILDAGLAGMRGLGLEPGALFLDGWSQGAFNTQWLAQELQRTGRPVRASAVQSPFNDLSETVRFWTGLDTYAPPTAAPYPARPAWGTLVLIILLGSHETYYGMDGLMEAAVRPEYQAMAAKYWRDYALDVDRSKPFPTTEELLVEGMQQRFTAEVNSRFLRQMASNRATYWDYAAPMRLYYGLADEAIHPALAQRPLPAGGARIDGVAVPGASHRVTFLASLYGAGAEVAGQPDLLRWFNTHLAG
ncbi:alpha/beta hydrolase family protein [Neoroseomonas lacus]|uniref:Lysophospholipase n=1 Tax=Neoroseomonas lacus TaxID=287609 RepID=A0A917KP07_9PROT|nr:hypothetical protein [Neoroseomonas lacus]GGJ23211.1 hypothetical protein GCM10011320_33150 [Neoroseomonas lacus]